MDGNGRWATRRGLPRTAGHREGVESVRRIIEAAPELGVGTLTLYAFSSDNWKRPGPEVAALMTLFRRHLREETAKLKKAGVRLTFIGRRDRLPEAVRAAAVRSEWETRHGDRLLLRLAVDYSSRAALEQAARLHATTGTPFGTCLHEATGGPPAPPVDLLVRTGGEQRLSDFLLWESAYAELLFLDTLWPDVTGETLAEALGRFHARERRFGGLPVEPVGGDGARTVSLPTA